MKKLLLMLLIASGISSVFAKAVETSLKPGETLTIEAEVPKGKPGEVNTLFFVARLQDELSVDGNYAMEIQADGQPLGELIGDIPRIVNRVGKTFHDTAHPYTKQGIWNVISNQYEDYIEIIHLPKDYSEVYCYELDISDLSEGKHTFTWKNKDPNRTLLIKMDKLVQSRKIVKTPYAPVRSFAAKAVMAQKVQIDGDGGEASWQFSLPEKPGHRPVLRLRARINLGKGWGYNNNLRLNLNGTRISGLMKNTNSRLFNRVADSFRGDRNCPAIDWKSDMCVFHHDSDDRAERLARFSTVEELQHFWIYLDISDIVDSKKENTLTFVNRAVSKEFGMRPGNPKLVVDCCEVGYVSDEAMAVLPVAATRKEATGISVKKSGYELSIQDKTFGVQLRRGKDLLFIDTSLSYPNGGKNMLYTAGAQVQEGEASWQPQVQVQGDIITVTAQGKYYTFSRKLICKDDVIHVRDTFKSLSDDVIGIIYSNDIVTGTVPKAIYKNGDFEPVTPWMGNHDYPAANSTFFVQLAKGGFGVFVEDDVFKLQSEYTVKGNLMNYKTAHFGFVPHGEYTHEWNLYPRQEGDYFDFINQVRDYLGVNNRQIPSAICWPLFYSTDELKRKHLSNLGYTFPAIYWFDYVLYDLTGKESVEYRLARIGKELSRCIKDYEKLKKLDPKLKPVFMWQNNYVRCNYADMDEPFFPDSCAKNPDGSIHKTSLGSFSANTGYFTHRYFEIGNSYYDYAVKNISAMLEKDLGAVYFDTPNHIQKSYRRFTYDKWDNFTVDIDPATGLVTRKYGDLCLISGPARIALAKMITDSGKFVYYNNPPILKGMINMKNCVHMVEGDTAITFAALHLTVPLSFGEHCSYDAPYRPQYGRRKTWLGAVDFMDDICWKIRNGVLYNAYVPPYGKEGEKGVSSVVMDQESPLKYMFPITVTDIHGGWIRGAERIVTIDSGTYGWKKSKETTIELRLFDKAGKNVTTEQRTSKNGMFDVTVPEKGMAILIRK